MFRFQADQQGRDGIRPQHLGCVARRERRQRHSGERESRSFEKLNPWIECFASEDGNIHDEGLSSSTRISPGHVPVDLLGRPGREVIDLQLDNRPDPFPNFRWKFQLTHQAIRLRQAQEYPRPPRRVPVGDLHEFPDALLRFHPDKALNGKRTDQALLVEGRTENRNPEILSGEFDPHNRTWNVAIHTATGRA